MFAFTLAGIVLILFFVFVLVLCTRDRRKPLEPRDEWTMDLDRKSRMGRWSY
jgi:hypothetical protein